MLVENIAYACVTKWCEKFCLQHEKDKPPSLLASNCVSQEQGTHGTATAV